MNCPDGLDVWPMEQVVSADVTIPTIHPPPFAFETNLKHQSLLTMHKESKKIR